jgi:hypothetical protein
MTLLQLYEWQAKAIQNHGNADCHNIGQGKATHRKYKRLKFGYGQAHDCPSGKAAIITGWTDQT